MGDTLSQLIKYEAACRALAECKSVDEAKSWTDKAAAMQAYGRMAKDKTLEVDAAEIRIRAERRLGEMLAASDLQAGGRPAKETGRPQRPVSAPKLADAGISKDLSSRAQKLAAVPAAEFEAELAAKRERDKQDGARVSARLEKAGEKALKSAGRSSTEAHEDDDDFAPSAEEIAESERAAADDAEVVRLLLESDDKLSALADKCKQQAALIRTLESRIHGLTNEAAQAIRLAKSWRQKYEKLERAAA